MQRTIKDLIILAGLCVGSTLLVWLPFFLGAGQFWGIPLPDDGMAAVVRNFDGPYYLVVAKTLYQPELVKQFEFDLPVEYYAAHYPFYPLLIRLLGLVLSFPYAMLTVTVITAVGMVWMFYWLVKELKVGDPLWLSVVLLVLPARGLVVRSVGSPEPLFLLLVMGSVYGMVKKNYWLAGICGAMAQLTKPPGALLFVAFGLYLASRELQRLNAGRLVTWMKGWPWKAYPLFLIPVSLVGLFWWYGQIYGDYMAYFNSGDNIHLFWPPFQMFNRAAVWVGTFWLEDMVWVLLLGAMGVVALWKRQDVISWFGLVFFSSTLFVAHRDLARYSLPLVPFLIIAFAPWLEKKEFKWALVVLVIPIYLFAVNFIAGNTTPVSDWGKLL